MISSFTIRFASSSLNSFLNVVYSSQRVDERVFIFCGYTLGEVRVCGIRQAVRDFRGRAEGFYSRFERNVVAVSVFCGSHLIIQSAARFDIKFTERGVLIIVKPDAFYLRRNLRGNESFAVDFHLAHSGNHSIKLPRNAGYGNAEHERHQHALQKAYNAAEQRSLIRAFSHDKFKERINQRPGDEPEQEKQENKTNNACDYLYENENEIRYAVGYRRAVVHEHIRKKLFYRFALNIDFQYQVDDNAAQKPRQSNADRNENKSQQRPVKTADKSEKKSADNAQRAESYNCISKHFF